MGEAHPAAPGERSGTSVVPLGRRRYLPDLTTTNRQRREMAERAALNSPIQGSAAEAKRSAGAPCSICRARAEEAAKAVDPPAVRAPRTWLLSVGWRRLGLLDPAEVPG